MAQTLSPDRAHEWITRWDRQQEGYLPDREERFTVLIDAVEAHVGRADPLVLDLGCGPGSLSARLLDRLPRATVVAVDADPLLLALGRACYSSLPGLRFAELDLRRPGWSRELGLERAPDAAVSTTALHWLAERDLRALYAELAGLLRPGGILLNGDHLEADGSASRLRGLEREIARKAIRRRFPDGHPEDWRQWWDAFTADPALASLMAGLENGSSAASHDGSESILMSTHVEALREAGFTEIDTIWQRGDDRILAALLP